MRFVNQFFLSTGKSDVFETEYESVIAYALANSIAIPSHPVNVRNNNRIKYLKAEGLWNSWDLLYFFDQEIGRSDFAKINMINPASNYLTHSDEPSFVSGSGFRGNGINQALNTHYRPATQKINVTDSSTSIIYRGFDFVNDAVTESIFGVRIGNTNKQLMVQSNDGALAIFRIQITTGQFGFGKTSHNLAVCYSATDSDSRIYRNGVSFFTRPVMSGAGFENIDLYLFAVNDNGTLSGNMKSGLKYWGIGSDIGTANPNPNPDLIYRILDDIYVP